MRRRDTYWSLFHTPEKRQINDLRTDHVEAVFEAIPLAHQKDWVIWREGFRSWKPFSDFPQLIQSLRQLKSPESAKPEPPPKDVIEQVSAPPQQENPNAIRKFDEKIETISLELKSDGDLAERETRYPKNWDLVIHTNTNKVTAKTVDVSINGLHLAEAITASLPRYFTVEIMGANQTFNVVCSAIRSVDMQPTSRLKIEVNEQKAAYTAAIMAK